MTLFPCLFEFTAQSANGTAILVFGMYVEIVRKWCFENFCTSGYCLVTKKVPGDLINQLAVLRLSSALNIHFLENDKREQWTDFTVT